MCVLPQFTIYIHPSSRATMTDQPLNLCEVQKFCRSFFSPANTLNIHITTFLISRSVSETMMNNTFARRGLCASVCACASVCVEHFLASFRQVFPPSPGTEMPTSPSTSRMSRPARPTPSTRPRTTSPASARTESSSVFSSHLKPTANNARVPVF